jgi:hypothetical protein
MALYFLRSLRPVKIVIVVPNNYIHIHAPQRLIVQSEA